MLVRGGDEVLLPPLLLLELLSGARADVALLAWFGGVLSAWAASFLCWRNKVSNSGNLYVGMECIPAWLSVYITMNLSKECIIFCGRVIL